jgi:hypothetical protein
MIINPNEQKKCAPGKDFTDGSCLTLESLQKIAENYNKTNTDKININLDKAELVKELETKLKNQCNEQTCWLRLDIIKKLEDEDIENNTFRPKGPTKKYEWLSTNHINDVVEQYMNVHKDFLFLGAVPYDFDDLAVLGISNLNFANIEKEGKHKIGMVINLDEHYKSGSHWVALYADLQKNQIYFFDSVGKVPGKRIRKFVNRVTKYLYNKKYHKNLPINDIISKLKAIKKTKGNINKNDPLAMHLKNLLGGEIDVRYNMKQHQFENSECGVYSINFIVRLVSGESFDNIVNNITSDEMMNKNREEYFRNVNNITSNN